ncbi:MAG: LysR family transcriptional regulator [bacterium]|nr:LysR family transcriptional regulator [bacterium]
MAFRFTLRQLEYFVAVCDAGSIAAASQLVNVSSPSISTAISQLENVFGLELFVRQYARGLSLTPGGRRFYSAAKEVLEGAGGLHDVAGEISGEVRGPISVGSLMTVAPFVLPELRKEFQAQHPLVTFQQAEGHQTDLIRMLRRADIDIAVTYDLEIPNDIAFEALLPMPPCALLGVDHPLASASAVSLGALADEPLILLDLPLSRDYFMSLFQRLDLHPRIEARTPNVSMVHAMVANGIGYGLLNVPGRHTWSPDGKPLRYVPIKDEARPMQLGLATMRADRKSRILSAFEEHCRKMVAFLTVFGSARG